MVKIVGRNDSAVKRVSCWNCASILEYTRMETLCRMVTDYGGSREKYTYINCPSCGKEVGCTL